VRGGYTAPAQPKENDMATADKPNYAVMVATKRDVELYGILNADTRMVAVHQKRKAFALAAQYNADGDEAYCTATTLPCTR
jgi:hypothetical protein